MDRTMGGWEDKWMYVTEGLFKTVHNLKKSTLRPDDKNMQP